MEGFMSMWQSVNVLQGAVVHMGLLLTLAQSALCHHINHKAWPQVSNRSHAPTTVSGTNSGCTRHMPCLRKGNQSPGVSGLPPYHHLKLTPTVRHLHPVTNMGGPVFSLSFLLLTISFNAHCIQDHKNAAGHFWGQRFEVIFKQRPKEFDVGPRAQEVRRMFIRDQRDCAQ